tara:strand:+ start:53 stop:439 length:387 start_codon:yes stop_codon:yes gene_type:complete
MKAYCPECGTKHEYTINKPNFCVSCGYAFAGAPPKPAAPAPEPEIIQEDEQPVSASYSNMSNLDIEMEINPRKGVSLGDIMASQLEEEQVNLDDLPKPKTQQISKEQVKQQFQSEAGALRPKSSSTED